MKLFNWIKSLFKSKDKTIDIIYTDTYQDLLNDRQKKLKKRMDNLSDNK